LRKRERERANKNARRADQFSFLFLFLSPFVQFGCRREETGGRWRDDLGALATSTDLPASIHATVRLGMDPLHLLDLLDFGSRGGL